jgi:hypothetical protein
VDVDEVADISDAYAVFMFNVDPEHGGSTCFRNIGNIVHNYIM